VRAMLEADRGESVTPLLPSDNPWDVPSLRLDMQAIGIVPPVLPWGALARGRAMVGTWHFFCDDYRFAALLRDPKRLPETGCAAAVEPNITALDHTPRHEVLHAIGRKRATARTWQDLGVPIFVDLNVPRRCHDFALLGVPREWLAYATRGYSARPDDLRAEHALATGHAGREPILLVIGGGKGVEALCRELPGAVYVADHHQQRRAVRAVATPALTPALSPEAR
jgi:hypothetical protein